MIEALSVVLPLIIYILLIVLLVVVIVLGIKFIIAIDKVNSIINEVQEKIDALSGIFKLAEYASNKLNYVSSKLIDTVMSMINKLLGVGNGKDEEDDYE